jgi:ABC-2 type transport system permease protein
MKGVYVIALVAVVLVVRLALRRRRRERDGERDPEDATEPTGATAARRRWHVGDVSATKVFGDVGLVATREIRERVKGRIFRIGTLVILLGVGAAIVIPKVHTSSPAPQRVGVVGAANPSLSRIVEASGRETQTPVRLVTEPSLEQADAALRAGQLDVVLADGGQRILVDQDVGPDANSTTATFVQALAANLGVLRAYEVAGLTSAQVEQLAHARPVAVDNLQANRSKGAVQSTSTVGIILLFLMLTQYNTWILMGVMQEKASRVVEVLLATVRPIQLLGGKILGIGLVAMGQAALIVGFALAVAAAVGSNLLHGTAPLVLLSELLWLVLGYAFYCWVYAAAGSMAERQDQVQTLVLPLSLPIILGYVLALTTASTGHASLFFEVLAYLPPTAPFAMPVLVGLGQVQWWQFVASVIFSLAGTAGMAWVASGIYRRAVLRSGQRVRLRDLTSSYPRRNPQMVTTR